MAGLELGLKDRHGEPVAEVLDAAKVTSGNDGDPSCSASGPGPRSSASLWRCGGRDPERDDLRGDGAPRIPGVSGRGAAPALYAGGMRHHRLPAGPGAGEAWAQHEADRTRSWRRGPISLFNPSSRRRPSRSTLASDPGIRVAKRSTAGAISTRTAPRTAGVRAPRRRHDGRAGAQRAGGRTAGAARSTDRVGRRGGEHGNAEPWGSRVQSRERSRRKVRARARTSLGSLVLRRRRPRAGASDGSR